MCRIDKNSGVVQPSIFHLALERFSISNPKMAELVKLRYFVGMTLEEAGQALGVTLRTAKRFWAYARAWLKAETKL